MTLSAPTATTIPTGPAIGDPFPDFTLPDQHGKPVSFAAARGERRAMVVVVRSASW